MVLGLGGAVLPPRPTARRMPRADSCQLARVHSNSLLEVRQTASAGALQAGGTAAAAACEPGKYSGSRGATHASVADLVDTPTGQPPMPQPACSDQSNVRGGQEQLLQPAKQQQEHHEPQEQQQQQHLEPPLQEQQQHTEPSPQEQLLQQKGDPGHGVEASTERAIPASTVQAAMQKVVPSARKDEQQQQQQKQHMPGGQQTASAPQPAEQAPRGRKRKAGSQRGPSSSLQAEHGTPGRDAQTRFTRSRLGQEGMTAASAMGRTKRQASSADGATGSGGTAAATPAAKRRKSSGKGAKSPRSAASKYADILHRTVIVPGAIFFVNKPGQVYVGHVNKLEKRRKPPSVEVQFQDDHSKYWFPVKDVRSWMADMVRQGKWEKYNPGVLPPTPPGEDGQSAVQEGEEEASAAKALQSISASLRSSSVQGDGAASRGGSQPALSSGRHPRKAADDAAVVADGAASQADMQLQRSGSELKRVGALDIMVAAADINRGGSKNKS